VTLQAVIIDLFHTLADPEEFRPAEFRRVEQAAALLGADRAGFAAYWAETAATRNRQREPSARGWLGEYLRRVGRAAEPAALAAVEDALGRYQDLAIGQPVPGATAALLALRRRGLRLALLSNAEARETQAWPRSPLAPLFDAVCFSCDIGAVKPEPAAYAAALTALGSVAPAAAVFVGDGGGGELRGAREAGFGMVVCVQGCVTRHGLRSPAQQAALAANADVVIDAVAELPALLTGA